MKTAKRAICFNKKIQVEETFSSDGELEARFAFT